MWFSVKSYFKIYQLFYTLVIFDVLFNPIMALHIYMYRYAFSIFTRQGCFRKNVQVHFISAVCENMISGKGMHPGDIVTASNGITIEVYSSFLFLDICHCEILYSCYWVQHALSHLKKTVWCWGIEFFKSTVYVVYTGNEYRCRGKANACWLLGVCLSTSCWRGMFKSKVDKFISNI